MRDYPPRYRTLRRWPPQDLIRAGHLWFRRGAVTILLILAGSLVGLFPGHGFGRPAAEPSARSSPKVEAFGPLWVSFYGGAVSYAPDGMRFAVSGPGAVFILDGETYQIEQRLLIENAAGNYAVSWSPDGRYVAADSIRPAMVHVWEVAGGELVASFRVNQPVWSLAWSADSRRLASAGQSQHEIRIWDVEAGDLIQTLSGVNAIAWSPDGQYVVCGYQNNVRIYSIETGALMQEWMGHGAWVSAVAWSPDGRYVASSGFGDSNIRLWDAASGLLARTLQHEGGASGIAWSPDGTYFAVVNGSVSLWDGTGDQWLGRMGEGQNLSLTRLSWRPDNKRWVTSGAKTVRLWDVQSGQMLASLYGHRGEVLSVGWSPDSCYVVSSGGARNSDRSVRIWDGQTGEEVRSLRDDVCRFDVEAVGWSPQGRYIAAGYQCDMIRLWDWDTGGEFRRLEPIRGDQLTWDPQGNYLAARTRDNRLKIWEVESGTLVRELVSEVGLLQWSPDGRYLASSFNRTIKIWEAKTGRLLMTIDDAHDPLAVMSLTWSPDSQYLASGGGDRDRKIKIWDVETGALARVITGHRWAVFALAWSPDGRYLASSDRDFPHILIKIWDVETGALRTELWGQGGEIHALQWSPDGQYLASGSYDSTVRVWGVKPRK